MKVNDFSYINLELTIDDFVILMNFFDDWMWTNDMSFDVIIRYKKFILLTFCVML